MVAKKEAIANAKALNRAYNVALAYDIDIDQPELHEQINELFMYYMTEQHLTFDDLN